MKTKTPMAVWNADGRRVKVAYDPALLAFTFDTVEIRNPLLDETCSIWMPATYYDFYPWHTGGGCMAYRLDLPNGDHFLLTTDDGSHLPDEPEDAAKALLGRYDRHGEPIADITLSDVPLLEKD